jgi:hypothetical protein
LGSASGHQIPAYLFPIRARMEDDFQGWAEWDAEFAFADMPKAGNLAGHVGFIEFFDVKSRGAFVDLEPIPHDPSTYFVYDCRHPHGLKPAHA